MTGVAKAEGKSNSAAIQFAAREAAAATGNNALGAILEVLSIAAVAELPLWQKSASALTSES